MKARPPVGGAASVRGAKMGEYLKILHVARRELGLDEDTWRALLARVTGKESLRAMDAGERRRVLEALKRQGFAMRPRAGGAGRVARPSDKRYIRLIHALWRECHERGIIGNGSREALRAFCHRFVAHGEAKVAVDPDLMDYAQAAPVIEALKKMVARGVARGERGK